MKIENLVLSIDQMNHLRELGVEVKDTALCWGCRRIVTPKCNRQAVIALDAANQNRFFKEIIPTLTLQEILGMLPKGIIKDEILYRPRCYLAYGSLTYLSLNYELQTFAAGDILENAYEILCWCAENGYLNKE